MFRVRLYILYILTVWSNACFGQLSQPQKQLLLTEHNFYRSVVGTQPLVWSEQLAQKAQQWAEAIAQNPLITHNPFGYGQNLFYATDTSLIVQRAVSFWAKEQVFYHGQIITDTNLVFFRHYTNMIWKDTRQLGCGLAQLPSKRYVLVCFYSPAGNIVGQSAIR